MSTKGLGFRSTALFLSLFLSLLFMGCLPGAGGSGTASSAGNTIASTGNSTSSSGGFNQGCGIPLSQELSLDYYMERVFKDYSVPEPRIYTERVWHTAGGDYRIERMDIHRELPDGTLESCSPEEVNTYNHFLTQGLGYYAVHDRGFRIRDAGIFLQNYNYTVLNDQLTFLGRKAILARITSHYQDRPNYTVWFDRFTGMVLRYEEDTLAVDPLYAMEVTQLNLQPDFTGIHFYNQDFHIQRCMLEPSQLGQLGFQVFVPIYVPSGFVPRRPEGVEMEGLLRLRFAYTDGVQEIVLSELSMEALLNKAGRHGANFPSSKTIPTPLTWVILGNEYEAGLQASHFTLGETRVVVRSAMDEMETASLIESLVPLQ